MRPIQLNWTCFEDFFATIFQPICYNIRKVGLRIEQRLFRETADHAILFFRLTNNIIQGILLRQSSAKIEDTAANKIKELLRFAREKEARRERRAASNFFGGIPRELGYARLTILCKREIPASRHRFLMEILAATKIYLHWRRSKALKNLRIIYSALIEMVLRLQDLRLFQLFVRANRLSRKKQKLYFYHEFYRKPRSPFYTQPVVRDVFIPTRDFATVRWLSRSLNVVNIKELPNTESFYFTNNEWIVTAKLMEKSVSNLKHLATMFETTAYPTGMWRVAPRLYTLDHIVPPGDYEYLRQKFSLVWETTLKPGIWQFVPSLVNKRLVYTIKPLNGLWHGFIIFSTKKIGNLPVTTRATTFEPVRHATVPLITDVCKICGDLVCFCDTLEMSKLEVKNSPSSLIDFLSAEDDDFIFN